MGNVTVRQSAYDLLFNFNRNYVLPFAGEFSRWRREQLAFDEFPAGVGRRQMPSTGHLHVRDQLHFSIGDCQYVVVRCILL